MADYQKNRQQNMNQNPYKPQGTLFPNPGQSFAMLSMFLGAGCVFTFFSVYLPIAMGSIAIILAIISKGYGKKMLLTAKLGMISGISCVAMLLSLIAIICAFIIASDRTTLTNVGATLDTQIERQIGKPAEEVFGISYEILMDQYADLLGK